MSVVQKILMMALDDGDVLGFSGQGLVSDAINIGTYSMPRWGLSHVGIVSTYKGCRYIFESTTQNGDKRCAISGYAVDGVQAHLLDDILTRPGKVWHYKLTKPLSIRRRNALAFLLESYLGRPYDMKGAARSGGFFLRVIESILRKQEVSRLFCSELVALVLTGIKVTDIMNASGQSPNSLVRHLGRNGICRKRVRIK